MCAWLAVLIRWGHRGQSLLHSFTDDSLLSLEISLTRLFQVLLKLIVGRTRLHNLLDFVLRVFNDLIGPLFLCLKQYNPIVQPDTVKLDLLATLTDLGNRKGNMLGRFSHDTCCRWNIELLVGCQAFMPYTERTIFFAYIATSLIIKGLFMAYRKSLTLRESFLLQIRRLVKALQVFWANHCRWGWLFAHECSTVLASCFNVLQRFNFTILIGYWWISVCVIFNNCLLLPRSV